MKVGTKRRVLLYKTWKLRFVVALGKVRPRLHMDEPKKKIFHLSGMSLFSICTIQLIGKRISISDQNFKTRFLDLPLLHNDSGMVFDSKLLSE